MFHISAILIAAGKSTRMGRPKALMNWHEETLLSYQIKSLIEDISIIIIVLFLHLLVLYYI